MLQFEDYQACETCKTKLDHCVMKDDLKQVLDAIHQADTVVMATPNYFWEVSGQFKSFFDGTYLFRNPDFTGRLAPGKSSVFIMAQGQTNLDSYADVNPRYEMWLKRYGFADNYLLRMNGPRLADSSSERLDLITEAESIAKDMMEPSSKPTSDKW